MSDSENFLTRWARRKREATDETRKDDAAADARKADARDGSATDEGDSNASRQRDTSSDREQPFDLESLPPIESITADTDIRAFFAPGVPADLTRAALRRAWSADPKIRDFVGLAENAWDFNDPGSMPGFGALEMTPDLRREVARIVGNFLPEEEALGPEPATPPQPVPESAPTSQAPEPSPQIAATSVPDYRSDEIAGPAPVESNMQPVELAPPIATTHRNKDDAATQQQSQRELSLPTSTRRGHGRALPK